MCNLDACIILLATTITLSGTTAKPVPTTLSPLTSELSSRDVFDSVLQGASSQLTNSWGTGTLRSGPQSRTINSGPQTDMNQLISGLNSTVKSLGLDASSFASPVILIFTNATPVPATSDGKVSMPPPDVSNASLLAAPVNSPEHSLDAEALAQKQPPTSRQREPDNERKASSSDSAPVLAGESLGFPKRKRLKRRTAVETDLKSQGSDMPNQFYDLDIELSPLKSPNRCASTHEAYSSVASSGTTSEMVNRLISNRGYACERCGKCYSRRAELIDHVHSHLGAQNM